MGAIGTNVALRVVGNTDLDRIQQQTRNMADAAQAEMPLAGIAGYVNRFWQAAQSAKLPIERQMLRALRQRQGIYEPEELALIRQQGGSEIYMMLTSAKCRGAESWLREILCSETDQPWGLEPTPMPDLPPIVSQSIIDAVAQQAMAAGWEIDDQRVDQLLLKLKSMAFLRIKDLAEKIAQRHEIVIADQFAEGGWEKALSDFIYDLVTFPAGFIKGPILRKAKSRQWMPGENGAWIPVVTDVVRPEYQRRSPLDIFPAPRMRRLNAGNLIDRYHFHRSELMALIGVPGYSETMIYAALDAYGMKGHTSSHLNDTQRALLEMRPNEQWDPEGTIEALNMWGSVPGHLLMEWGFQNRQDTALFDSEGNRLEPNREYQVEVWQLGRYTIKAIINPDPLGEKPYSRACFEEIPDSIWGLGLPDCMMDSAKMCNAAARAIANNAGIASGPQVDLAVDRLADGEPVTKPYPWKVWQTISDATGQNQPAIRFFQPQMNVHELLLIYNHFERVADNETGFPNYTYGDGRVGGAGRTSSGLAQLMGNVGKGVRRVVGGVDRDVVKPIVTRTFEYNMEYNADPAIKFDLRAVPRGSTAVLIKDMVNMRQRELLQATLNPLDAQIIGVKGRAEMLRPVLKSAEFPVDKIMPDDLELQLAMASMPPPHQLLGKTGPNAAGAPPAGAGGGQEGGEGGTPEGPENTDNAGQPAQGAGVRKAAIGMRDGGRVSEFQGRRFFMNRLSDGSVIAEELP